MKNFVSRALLLIVKVSDKVSDTRHAADKPQATAPTTTSHLTVAKAAN